MFKGKEKLDKAPIPTSEKVFWPWSLILILIIKGAEKLSEYNCMWPTKIQCECYMLSTPSCTLYVHTYELVWFYPAMHYSRRKQVENKWYLWLSLKYNLQKQTCLLSVKETVTFQTHSRTHIQNISSFWSNVACISI